MSGCRLSPSLRALVASWVAVAHAPAVFNLQHLFVCFVNEYARWKHLLVLLYPHYRGPFILLDCGWSDARSSRPKSRHHLATSPLPPGPFTSHSVSRYYLAPISTTGLSSKPHWHHSSEWGPELVCINILKSKN